MFSFTPLCSNKCKQTAGKPHLFYCIAATSSCVLSGHMYFRTLGTCKKREKKKIGLNINMPKICYTSKVTVHYTISAIRWHHKLKEPMLTGAKLQVRKWNPFIRRLDPVIPKRTHILSTTQTIDSLRLAHGSNNMTG